MNKQFIVGCLVGAGVLYAFCSLAGEIRLGGKCTIDFADLASAKAILTNRDEFIQALSPFDRAARMKVETAPSQEVFLRFLAANALTWKPAESNRIAGLLVSLAGKLARWDLPLPPTVILIKTTGKEEGNVAYTRQNAIILSQHEAAAANSDLLAHELFHVLSRHDAQIRQRLYGVLGFLPINEVKLPPALSPIKITNPDGVHNNFMIVVRSEGQPLPVVPILYSSAPHYDAGRGGEFFEYLVFKLLALQKTAEDYQPPSLGGNVQLFDPAAVTGFFEQIGKNTDYIIHPDEILADNFVRLVNGTTNLATPRIVAEMNKVLAAPAPAAGK